MNDSILKAEHIDSGYNHKTIVSDVNVTVPKTKSVLYLAQTDAESQHCLRPLQGFYRRKTVKLYWTEKA